VGGGFVFGGGASFGFAEFAFEAFGFFGQDALFFLHASLFVELGQANLATALTSIEPGFPASFAEADGVKAGGEDKAGGVAGEENDDGAGGAKGATDGAFSEVGAEEAAGAVGFEVILPIFEEAGEDLDETGSAEEIEESPAGAFPQGKIRHEEFAESQAEDESGEEVGGHAEEKVAVAADESAEGADEVIDGIIGSRSRADEGSPRGNIVGVVGKKGEEEE
jgi:hypothetical protein